MKKFEEMNEMHCEGHIDISEEYKNFPHDLQNADLGIQISYDGRVWLCINGIAFLRFKPKFNKER